MVKIQMNSLKIFCILLAIGFVITPLCAIASNDIETPALEILVTLIPLVYWLSAIGYLTYRAFR